MVLRLALPLGQLGHCLGPPSGRGPQNFEKVGIVGKKNISDASPKNLIHSYDQKKQKIWYIPVNIGSLKNYLV